MKSKIIPVTLSLTTLFLVACQSSAPEPAPSEREPEHQRPAPAIRDFRYQAGPGNDFRGPGLAFSPGPGPAPRRFERLARQSADKNGDGLISQAEYLYPVEARIDDLFLRLDRNSDNRITAADLPENPRPEPESTDERTRERFSRMPFGPGPERREALQACLDETDTVLSDNRPELMALTREQMQDDNLSLDLSAFSAPAKQRALENFQRIDLDNNGQLDENELRNERETDRARREHSREMLRECFTANRSEAPRPPTN